MCGGGGGGGGGMVYGTDEIVFVVGVFNRGREKGATVGFDEGLL